MNLLKSELFRFAAGVLVLMGLWTVTNKVNQNLVAELPVLQAQQVEVAPPAPAPATIYSVFVGPGKLGRAGDAADVDEAFAATAAQQAERAAPEPDYAEQIRPNIRVDGVTHNGAFINGRFYLTGTGLEALATMRSDGVSLIPRLASVNPERVVIAVGRNSLILSNAGGVWQ